MNRNTRGTAGGHASTSGAVGTSRCDVPGRVQRAERMSQHEQITPHVAPLLRGADGAARRPYPLNTYTPVGIEDADKEPRGLAHSKTWRKAAHVAWTVAASALLTGAALAGDLPRTADYDYDPPAPGTYTLPVVKRAADGEVLDAEGHPLPLRELTHGRITVLSFIYTRCAAAKACPYATGVLNQLSRLSQEDPSLAQEMRLVSMSFDPANDTPARMAAYSSWARGRTSAAEWRFITTRSAAELSPILNAYGQAVDRKKNPSDPTGPLNHTLRVFLIDRDGNIRNIYSSGTLDARLVLADVRTLIAQGAQTRPGALLGPEPHPVRVVRKN